MKRIFAYLTVAVILGLLLCGCGGKADQGNVGTSPWPEMTVPVTPVPTAALSPLPDPVLEKDTAGTGGSMSTVAPDMSTSAPRMTSSPELSSSPNPTDTSR